MAKVFVSYSRKDIEFAKQLTAELTKSDLDFWIDWEGIPPTVDWWKEIEKGIEEADVFLFLISPDSAKSKICGQEIDTAVKNGKRIIPIVVREIEWEDTPPQLGHLNYIFFSRNDDFDTAVRKLMTAIHTDYEWAATHRRLQVKALEWERKNKENSFLLRGKDLQEAEQQLATNSSKEPYPTDLQREYVFASRQETNRQQLAEDKRRRNITRISIAGVIALAALAVFGFYQAGQASNNAATAQANLVVAQTAQVDAQNKQVLADNNAATAVANEAEAKRQATISRAGELAALALSEQDKHFDLALLLGLEGFHKFQNSRTEGTLLTLADSHPGLVNHLYGQNARITSVIFSPDGNLLITGGADANEASITLWDVSGSGTYSMLSKVSIPASADLNFFNLVLSPDGNLLASADDGADDLILWDIRDSKKPSKLAVVPQGSDFIFNVAFSPKGSIVATSIGDSIILWDVGNPVTPARITTLSDNSNIFYRIAFSPDGNLIAAGSFDGTVILWDITNPNFPFKIATLPAQDYNFIIRSVAFSPNGNLLAFGTDFSTLNLWDVSDPTFPRLLSVQSIQAGIISSITFSLDSSHMALGTQDYQVVMLDISNPASPSQLAALKGHASSVYSVAFSPDSKRLASGSGDKNVILWNVSNQSNPPQLARLTGYSTGIQSIAYGANAKQLATGGIDNNIILWDVSNLASPVYLSTLTGHMDKVDSIAYSPDNNLLASGSDDDTAILWNVSDPTAPSKLATLEGHAYSVNSVTFSPNGRLLALGEGGADGMIALWDVSNPTAPSKIAMLRQTALGIDSVAFGPSGKILAAVGTNTISDQTVTLWDISDPIHPSQLAVLPESGIVSVTISPQGNLMAVTGENIKLWNISNPTSPSQIATLRGHTDNVWKVAFSPDGKQLISGSLDHTVILWDISNLIAPTTIGTLHGHTDSVTDVGFSHDGNMAFSASYDASVILWDLDPQSWVTNACQRVGRNFTPAEWALYFPDETYRKTCEQWPAGE